MKKSNRTDPFWRKQRAKFLNLGEDNMNIASVTLRRQAQTSPDKVAFICVDRDFKAHEYTYHELDQSSNQFANLLIEIGIRKNDHVFIFLPRIVESIISFYGIIKSGAVAGLLFSAFEEQALLDRLNDSQAKVVVTTQALYPRILKIQNELPDLEKIIIVGDTKTTKRIISFNEAYTLSKHFDIVHSSPDDDAFMLYTSGSTGKPKGIVHSHQSIISMHLSFKEVFNPGINDVYWCTADIGWITGISYILLAPVSLAVTTIFYEGRFNPTQWYELMEKYRVSILYTAPTAIRMLMASNISPKNYDMTRLKKIGSVGEPLNPECIKWGEKHFGITIMDTWFQTELGSISISNTFNLLIKFGSMGKPLPGIEADIINENDESLGPNELGDLVVRPNFPSFMKTIWKNQIKYNSTIRNGWYHTGDIAYKDKDGYIYFSGRSDDLINTQGERIGPFEIESILLSHELVIEAGAIGKPDPLRGEIIKAFVVLNQKITEAEILIEELKLLVKNQLGGPLYPREIEIVESLPKTRSGKIMRRVLKARELQLNVGDLSSLDQD